MMERWSVIPQAPDYAVSNMGRVRRETASRLGQPGRILKSPVTAKGYFRIPLRVTKKGPVRCFFVHRLVAQAFLPPRPGPDYSVAHEDGNPQNNSAENLVWKTTADNNRDRIRHGTIPRGERHPSAKLTEQQVREIRCAAPTTTFEALARQYGVCANVIANAAKGRSWRHVR